MKEAKVWAGEVAAEITRKLKKQEKKYFKKKKKNKIKMTGHGCLGIFRKQ